ncbi:hypothetical protein BU26DRAFT_506762 [Trematosphaeria pertusa]|uniref:Uncharacterized protein n=1 Tax=Trematosphaeria pertusa TaxID=390896 RepID=A0A6A6ICB1_9PLEO|nr:uncharacterized protein BU26DRAFT_506762 [Trematosphaeria pertusa]KAF2247542.1 hypothetical protein BU26DRAFT_506762 [Trematosphaeria pertusa]
MAGSARCELEVRSTAAGQNMARISDSVGGNFEECATMACLRSLAIGNEGRVRGTAPEPVNARLHQCRPSTTPPRERLCVPNLGLETDGVRRCWEYLGIAHGRVSVKRRQPGARRRRRRSCFISGGTTFVGFSSAVLKSFRWRVALTEQVALLTDLSGIMGTESMRVDKSGMKVNRRMYVFAEDAQSRRHFSPARTRRVLNAPKTQPAFTSPHITSPTAS